MDLRPAFHLASADRWINDPCGLIHLDGRWHVYTQTNPWGLEWGNMSWGHATSTDLVHWRDHGIALECTEQLDIFTGSTLLDEANLTGFGTAGNPPLLAYWTGHHRPASAEAPREDQRLAYSLDRGATFTVPESVNPVLTRHSTDFRDPQVFPWHPLNGSQVVPDHPRDCSQVAPDHFVMVTVEANDRQVLIYTSSDLLTWELASTFGPLETPIGIWECPSLVPLARGADTVWLLTLSAFGDEAQLPGTHYWLGDFDGRTFTPHDEFARPFDFGPDLYATATFARTPPAPSHAGIEVSEPRQMALGWLSNPVYAAATPLLGDGGSGGRGCLSLPRELGLTDTADGWSLTQRVPDEVRSCLGAPQVVAADTTELVAIELRDPVGLVTVTLVDPGARVELDGISVRREHALLTLERSSDRDLGLRYPVTNTVPLADPGGPVTLEAWVDRASIEVFTEAGLTWSASRFPLSSATWRTCGQVRVSYRPIT